MPINVNHAGRAVGAVAAGNYLGSNAAMEFKRKQDDDRQRRIDEQLKLDAQRRAEDKQLQAAQMAQNQKNLDRQYNLQEGAQQRQDQRMELDAQQFAAQREKQQREVMLADLDRERQKMAYDPQAEARFAEFQDRARKIQTHPFNQPLNPNRPDGKHGGKMMMEALVKEYPDLASTYPTTFSRYQQYDFVPTYRSWQAQQDADWQRTLARKQAEQQQQADIQLAGQEKLKGMQLEANAQLAEENRAARTQEAQWRLEDKQLERERRMQLQAKEDADREAQNLQKIENDIRKANATATPMLSEEDIQYAALEKYKKLYGKPYTGSEQEMVRLQNDRMVKALEKSITDSDGVFAKDEDVLPDSLRAGLPAHVKTRGDAKAELERLRSGGGLSQGQAPGQGGVQPASYSPPVKLDKSAKPSKEYEPAANAALKNMILNAERYGVDGAERSKMIQELYARYNAGDNDAHMALIELAQSGINGM